MPRKDSGEPVWGQGELDLGRVPVGRAKICPLPESEPGLTGNVAASGVNTSEPFAHFDHGSSSWKTYQVCLLTNTWDVFSETWPRAGTMRSGIAYQRPSLGHRTDEIESGLWPTPEASLNIAPYSPKTARNWGGLRPSGAQIGSSLRWFPAFLNDSDAGGKLVNPVLCELMMGYPMYWTDCTLAATPSSPKSRNGSAGTS